MNLRLWKNLHKIGVPQDLLCNLGLHHLTNEFVGILYGRCGNCKERVQVATPYTYEPHAGRNKYDEKGFLTYD